jgi:hypothetical protein
MRLRRLVLVLFGIAVLLGVLRRLRPAEFVEVQFEDGAAVRLTRGIEADDLLDDAYSILETVG